MRLVFLISTLRGGGAERVTINLANYWAEKGWKITILTLAPVLDDVYVLNPAIERRSLYLENTSKNLAQGLFNNLRRIRTLRRVLLEIKPQVVIGAMDTASILLALAAYDVKGMITIGAIHTHLGNFTPKFPWGRVRNFAFKRLDVVAALTKKTADWLLNNTTVKRTEVIPNPIPYPLPSAAPIVDPKSVCRPSQRILLAAGRLNPVKGFDLLVEAFSLIAPRYPDWDLVIVGEGAERQNLEHFIQRKGLAQRVRLAGWAGNLADWYAHADIYVMSSRYEGFPNTLAEAMAYGLPAVSFDCDTGPQDIIREGVDGFLIPLGDIEGLAQGLTHLMDDEGLRAKFGRAAQDVRTRFSLDSVAQKWEDLIRSLDVKAGGQILNAPVAQNESKSAA